MQHRSPFFEAARAMFLFSLMILGGVIILILFSRLITGATPPPPHTIYGTKTATQAMVASALGASEPAKAVGDTGLVALDHDGFVYVSETRIDRSPIGLVCGSIQTHGASVYSGFLYENVAYMTYEPYDTQAGAYPGAFVGDSIHIKTGEAHERISEKDLPYAITSLTDSQKYGSDPLPAGVTRLDTHWYNTLPGTEFSVITSQDCMSATLGGLGAAILFGLLFGVAWIIEKVRGY